MSTSHCSGSDEDDKQGDGDASTRVPHWERGLLKDMGWESTDEIFDCQGKGQASED
jgi:hypothetical protein